MVKVTGFNIRKRFMYHGKCFVHRDRSARWKEQLRNVELCDECKKTIEGFKDDGMTMIQPYKPKKLSFDHIKE